MPKKIPLSEAADRLGLAITTLRSQIHNGRLRAEKLGPIWVVDERELVRYERESRGQAGRPEGAKDRRPRRRKVDE